MDIKTPHSDKKRYQTYIQSQAAKGLERRAYWAKPSVHEQLKQIVAKEKAKK